MPSGVTPATLTLASGTTAWLLAARAQHRQSRHRRRWPFRAQIYGGGAVLRAIEFLNRTKTKVEAGSYLAELVHAELKLRRSIAGYGRPIASGDERIAPMMALVRELGLNDGRTSNSRSKVEKILLAGRWRLHMNYAALTAALGADFGLTRAEFIYL